MLKFLRLLLFTTVGTTLMVSAAPIDHSSPKEDLVPLIPPRPRNKVVAKKTKPKNEEKIKRLALPDDAVKLALADLLTIALFERPFQRYIWVPNATTDDVKAATIALGVISRASVPVIRPYPFDRVFGMPVAPDTVAPMLLRVDLRKYAPRERDLIEWVKLWENFAFDPMFNLLLTRDELKFAARYGLSEKDLPSRDVDVIRVNGPHIDPGALYGLQVYTLSKAPIVSDNYFAWRVLSTIKDKGVYAQVWGGLYYEFRGIRKAKDVKGKEKATDLDLFLEDAGVGNIKAGFTADKLFDKLRSDQRVAMFKSGVTGKPRRADWFHGPDSRDGTGSISVTHDLRDQDVDIGTHPVFNLIDFKAAAFEVIAERTNGFHAYAIFDAEQKLLDETGQDVVSDRTVPSPWPPRLQSGISCIACHEASGDDGWKPMVNDVKKLLSRKLDVFGDLSQKNRLQDDIIDRLAGLYAGDFTKSLRRGRDDYAETLFRCGGSWGASKDQTDIVKVAMNHLVDRTRGYYFSSVTPRMALAELGLEVSKGKEVDTLNALLPPDPEALVGGYFLESPVIGALKENVSVNRSDWGLAYSFAALRSRKTLINLLKTPSHN